MKRNFPVRLPFYVLVAILIQLVLYASSRTKIYAQKKKLIPVLIVDGFSNHDWQQTTTITKWILEESGQFKVDVSTIPTDSLKRFSWLPKFDRYAVVIQNTNNIHNDRLRWPPSV